MRFLQTAAALVSLASVVAGQDVDVDSFGGPGKGKGPGPKTPPKPLINSKKLQSEITTKGLMNNLQKLYDIAVANGGNRAFGLPGYAASVDYVWSKVSKVKGVKAYKQDFPALFNFVDSISLTVDGEDVYVYGLTYSPSTSAEGVTAEIVAGPEGAAGCDVASYDGLDVKDKIVLVQRFRCPTGGTLAGRLLPAARAGAAAVIIYHDLTTNATAGSLSAPNPEHVPGGFINLVDGEKIKARLAAGETVTATFQQTQTIETRITQNIIVDLEGGDENNVIVLGAHLDSVQAGPGINDDGSGTSLLLELFAAANKYSTKNKVRFAWWGAEENGLLGSKYYTQNLSVKEADKILAYLNFDMVAKGFIGVGDADGSEHGLAGPPGSDVIERIYIEHFTKQGVEVTPAVITNGSDYASFWQVLNKPFGFLHTGTGVAQDPCYHQACDTIANPDPKTITINAKAAAHMLSVLSVDGTKLIPKTPINATMFAEIRTRSIGPDVIQIAELEALGERHLGCGHEI
ncbi:putative aminopeptidase precursor [Podospora fimiseda]|uniref:Peptide hydrolase n=1 Tax=Podospora fimiseda TaxID=252190 RepID=A0AAN7GUL2_9PEZI|nr:putative aminopeptidase precursor [Podospora fimiseda]